MASTLEKFDTNALHRITGVVRELHPKSGDTWSRAKLQLDTGNHAWAVGKFRLDVGEIITANATFNSKFHSYDLVELITGHEGEVSNAVVVLKLIDYLPGVGVVKATELSEAFPDTLFDTLINDPEAIAKSCGADVRDVIAVGEDLKNEQTTLGRLSQLIAKGWPNHLAKRVCSNDTHFKIAISSPYRAIPLIAGLGWKIADEIGRKQGIALDAVERIDAGIEHYYTDKIGGVGHTIVPENVLLSPSAVPSLLGVREEKIQERLPEVLVLLEDGRFTSHTHYKNAQSIASFFFGDSE